MGAMSCELPPFDRSDSSPSREQSTCTVGKLRRDVASLQGTLRLEREEAWAARREAQRQAARLADELRAATAALRLERELRRSAAPPPHRRGPAPPTWGVLACAAAAAARERSRWRAEVQSLRAALAARSLPPETDSSPSCPSPLSAEPPPEPLQLAEQRAAAAEERAAAAEDRARRSDLELRAGRAEWEVALQARAALERQRALLEHKVAECQQQFREAEAEWGRRVSTLMESRDAALGAERQAELRAAAERAAWAEERARLLAAAGHAELAAPGCPALVADTGTPPRPRQASPCTPSRRAGEVLSPPLCLASPVSALSPGECVVAQLSVAGPRRGASRGAGPVSPGDAGGTQLCPTTASPPPLPPPVPGPRPGAETAEAAQHRRLAALRSRRNKVVGGGAVAQADAGDAPPPLVCGAHFRTDRGGRNAGGWSVHFATVGAAGDGVRFLQLGGSRFSEAEVHTLLRQQRLTYIDQLSPRSTASWRDSWEAFEKEEEEKSRRTAP